MRKFLSFSGLYFSFLVLVFFIVAWPVVAQTAASLNAAVLPGSRATPVNTAITVFASIVNGGDTGATGCSVALSSQGNPPGLAFSYRAFQADNATPAAPTNTPVDIAGHSAQAFVLLLTPSSAFAGTDINFDFSCSSGENAPLIPGVNTLFMISTSGPTADIITIAATPTHDGTVRILTLGGAEVMTVAAINIGNGGASTAVIVAPDTGAFMVPLDLFVCETDPQTSLCKAPPALTVNTAVGSSPATFAVFANSTRGSGVPDFPDIARVHLRFFNDTSAAADHPVKAGPASPKAPLLSPPPNGGDVVGSTSASVTSPGPSGKATDLSPLGIFQAVLSEGIHRYVRTCIGSADQSFLCVPTSMNAHWDVPAGKLVLPDYQKDQTSLNAFPDPGSTTPPDGQSPGTFTYTVDRAGKDSSGSAVNKFYSAPGNFNPGMQVGFSATPVAGESGTPFIVRAINTALYNLVVTFSDLAANYVIYGQDPATGQAVSVGSASITAGGQLTGTITEQGSSCSISGSFKQQNVNNLDKNMFSFSGSRFGAMCPTPGEVNGYAFILLATALSDRFDVFRVFLNALSTGDHFEVLFFVLAG